MASSKYSRKDIEFLRALIENKCEMSEICQKLSVRMGWKVSRYAVAGLCYGSKLKIKKPKQKQRKYRIGPRLPCSKEFLCT